MGRTSAEAFEDRYLALFWKWRRQQWDNYLDAAHHDLCAVDSEMFDLVSCFRDKIDAPGRRGQVLNAILLRDLVDKHPDVARLRNKLDDWDNYSRGLSAAQMQDRSVYRLILARRMKDDVLRLMETRQRLARQLGFPSYVDLVLFTEDLELASVTQLLEGYLDHNLPAARALFQAHAVSWPTGSSDLGNIGHVDGDPAAPGSGAGLPLVRRPRALYRGSRTGFGYPVAGEVP